MPVVLIAEGEKKGLFERCTFFYFGERDCEEFTDGVLTAGTKIFTLDHTSGNVDFIIVDSLERVNLTGKFSEPEGGNGG